VKIAEEKSNEKCMAVEWGGLLQEQHVQEVISGYLVAHSAQFQRENVFSNLNSHDVICFINSKREKY
jgi:hypothetical protein